MSVRARLDSIEERIGAAPTNCSRCGLPVCGYWLPAGVDPDVSGRLTHPREPGAAGQYCCTRCDHPLEESQHMTVISIQYVDRLPALEEMR